MNPFRSLGRWIPCRWTDRVLIAGITVLAADLWRRRVRTVGWDTDLWNGLDYLSSLWPPSLAVVLPPATLLALLTIWFLPKRQADAFRTFRTPKERFDVENEARRTIAQIVGASRCWPVSTSRPKPCGPRRKAKSPSASQKPSR